MKSKKALIKENEELKRNLECANMELEKLNWRLNRPIKANTDIDLNLKYMTLISKYNKLMDSCLSKETEQITYNGELYGIKSIDYHKDAESVDTIHIEAVHIPRQKGLINDLAEPFKNVAKELNTLFFGNDNN